MPKTEQSNSRSRSQSARRKALHTQLSNRIKSLKEDGAKDIMGDSRVRSLMDRIDSLSSGAEMSNRRERNEGRTPTRGSGLQMAKGGLVKKANCGASMKPTQNQRKK